MSSLIGRYKNGNYYVAIYSDGTKIRENNSDCFMPEKPESIDIKISNRCDMNCVMCHENSTPDGAISTLLDAPFFDTLLPYTELAIGGGNVLEHPQLAEFLVKLKERNLIANMTVNQSHFMDNVDYIKSLVDSKLIYGLGVSLVDPSNDFIESVSTIKNAVIHVVNGINDAKDFRKLYDKDLKVLILGYKEWGRGKTFYEEFGSMVRKKAKEMFDELPCAIDRFSVISFDNLAIKQLDVKRLMSQREWDRFYMGDDGQFTMYIDLVRGEFARNSTSEKRYGLKDNIKDMFSVIQNEDN